RHTRSTRDWSSDVCSSDLVRYGITQVPGGRGLLPNLTVDENLRMGAYPIRRDKRAVKAGFERVYTTFPRLAERRKQLAGLLSGEIGRASCRERGEMAVRSV